MVVYNIILHYSYIIHYIINLCYIAAGYSANFIG